MTLRCKRSGSGVCESVSSRCRPHSTRVHVHECARVNTQCLPLCTPSNMHVLSWAPPGASQMPRRCAAHPRERAAAPPRKTAPPARVRVHTCGRCMCMHTSRRCMCMCTCTRGADATCMGRSAPAATCLTAPVAAASSRENAAPPRARTTAAELHRCDSLSHAMEAITTPVAVERALSASASLVSYVALPRSVVRIASKRITDVWYL